MIHAKILLDGEGVLKSCAISGHAGAGSAGNDIVCAAVSVLARTAARVFQSKHCITTQCLAPQRGEFMLEIERNGKARGFVEAAGSFLIEGLNSIALEYPDRCHVAVQQL
jgi:uncharacterized protein YsxB (DUF464 family)